MPTSSQKNILQPPGFPHHLPGPVAFQGPRPGALALRQGWRVAAGVQGAVSGAGGSDSVPGTIGAVKQMEWVFFLMVISDINGNIVIQIRLDELIVIIVII